MRNVGEGVVVGLRVLKLECYGNVEYMLFVAIIHFCVNNPKL